MQDTIRCCQCCHHMANHTDNMNLSPQIPWSQIQSALLSPREGSRRQKGFHEAECGPYKACTAQAGPATLRHAQSFTHATLMSKHPGLGEWIFAAKVRKSLGV